MTPTIAAILFAALTEMQVTEIISIFRQCIDGAGDAVRTIWTALSPALIGYVVWRVASLQKDLLAKGQEREKRIIEKIDANTEISAKAFDVANGHNEKIAKLTEQVMSQPQQVEVMNTTDYPVPTETKTKP